ncbi:MAG: PQQ-binding-like beta-propeller repeat protein [Candidatus Andeanibacterium colombiense]|uniref:PQQ-binding-like beta-propeller repeat protein n=1 Tax=Candidatus Andeanibacterium colombiense TaxID=3121345 RepID=A0AAJ5XB40_9SPHN|nr:MAG: PQQ-binding-like beta-propeller repeat protein [Sphingomonadaceae bacterium]
MNSTAFRRLGAISTVAVLAVALSGCGIFHGKGGPKTPTVGNRVPILSRIEAGTSVDPTLAAVTVVVPPPQVNADWSQAGGTASKSYGHLALSDNPNELWRASIAGSGKKRRLAASPVIGNGTLFVMDTDGVVDAFDANTGTPKWHYKMPVPGKIEASAFGGGVSYSNGRVYATNGVGDVAALDAADGKVYWSVKPSGPLRGAPTIAFNAVIAMTQDNQVISLNAADGAIQWTKAGSAGQTGIFGVAAAAAAQGSIVAGYSTGEVAAYRYENGRELWLDALSRTNISTEVGALTDVDADPIIDNGRVYALGQGGRMAAYELNTGQRVWELNLAGISTPAIAGEWIFTLTDDARLMAIARNTGKIRWLTQFDEFKKPKKRIDRIFWTGPVLAGNHLWVANSRGKVFSVDVASGKPTEFRDLGSSISLAPVVANQILYILDDKGTIHAFR